MITVVSDYQICKEDKMHVSLIWISAGAIFETSLIVRDDSMKSFLSFIADCKRWFSEIIKKTSVLFSGNLSAAQSPSLRPMGCFVRHSEGRQYKKPISYQRRSAGQVPAPFISIHFCSWALKGVAYHTIAHHVSIFLLCPFLHHGQVLKM